MSHGGPVRLQPLSNDPAGAPGSSLQAIKIQQKVREDNEKARLKRVKGALVLVMQFLLDQGYVNTLQTLQQECNVSFQQYMVADNVDLLSIIMEYEQYFEFRFNRRPKLFRVADGTGNHMEDIQGGGEAVVSRRRNADQLCNRGRKSTVGVAASKIGYGNITPSVAPPCCSNQDARKVTVASGSPACGNAIALAPKSHAKPSSLSPKGIHPGNRDVELDHGLSLEGQRIDFAFDQQAENNGAEGEDVYFGRALKPLPRFPTAELQELAMAVQRDILDVNPNVRWNGIAALDEVKRLLKEAVVMPVKYPQLFAGIVRPWKGILLFGPPGTGKTLLAKAVATECRTTFFNISAASVVSKWRGDSEKLVRILFDLAVHYAPTTIFIDEIDSLMSSRTGEGMHEGSRRMKTELLIQMDGLSKRRGGEVVFVLAASNTPWDLDMAMLRRLEKRILVGLPSHEARATMFRQILTPAVTTQNIDWDACANITEGMSGADIDVICREAMMRPIRLMIEQLESTGDSRDLTPETLRRPLVTMGDITASVACTQSSVRKSDLIKYEDWSRKYGSGASS
ncbi:putative Holliday junction DNA helicase ruvB N terminus domain [Trypanosoma vivax]|nr:katanin-like protein [Trypanosoma vivax]KAH8611713.1 putative Holliday junction DNA helicase ruvB N terminus domain [Trypanosoma vivax]